MATIVGKGEFTYEVVMEWAKLDKEWSFPEASDVAVDSQDRVYICNRGAYPVIIFDREGKVLTGWGQGIFKRPHGITVGPDGSVYVADDADHAIRKFTYDGKLLMTIGTPGTSAPRMGGQPFNHPTKVALDPATGDLYVSDGYQNCSVHKFSPEGKHLFSWGESGTGPGQFNLVHSVSTDLEGRVYVVDRENFRIQVFDAKGKFLTQWVNLTRPSAVAIDSIRQVRYISELGPDYGWDRDVPYVTPRVSIVDMEGQPLVRLGGAKRGEAPGEFIRPHGVGVDSRGDLYVTEVSYTHIGSKQKPPRVMQSLRKLVRR
jgi:DNA-binding beta-propeller fold protein YncE